MIQQFSDSSAVANEMIDKGQSFFTTFQNLSLDDAVSKMANSIVSFGFKLLIAVLVFYIGRYVITKIYKFTYKVMVNRKLDLSLTTFILSLVKIVLYFILIVTVIGILGIETSSFLALFASAGVAIGMALSGTLQNFAGGVLILLLKPYKVGDYIEAQGYTGTVKSIQIFHTVINTVDNKAIIIPNGGLSTGTINNFSLEHYRRVDWTIALSYGADFEAARKLILEMLNDDARVVKHYIEDDEAIRESESENSAEVQAQKHDELAKEAKMSWWKRMKKNRQRHKELLAEKFNSQINLHEAELIRQDRSPFVGLNELADNSINVVVRAWTHSSNYWSLYFDMNERFYKELPEKGFEFPFPQLDVHIGHN